MLKCNAYCNNYSIDPLVELLGVQLMVSEYQMASTIFCIKWVFCCNEVEQ